MKRSIKNFIQADYDYYSLSLAQSSFNKILSNFLLLYFDKKDVYSLKSWNHKRKDIRFVKKILILSIFVNTYETLKLIFKKYRSYMFRPCLDITEYDPACVRLTIK